MSSDWSGGGEGIAGGGGHSRCSGLCWEVGQVGESYNAVVRGVKMSGYLSKYVILYYNISIISRILWYYTSSLHFFVTLLFSTLYILYTLYLVHSLFSSLFI